MTIGRKKQEAIHQQPAEAAPQPNISVPNASSLAPPPDAVPSGMTDLGHARALPEVAAGQVLPIGPVEFAAGSIERFADADGRTMEIVAIAGVLHKRAVHDEQPEDTTEEA